MNSAEYNELMEIWKPYDTLTEKIGDFVLRSLHPDEVSANFFFCYENTDKNWRMYGFFNSDTNDFMVRYDLGLMEITEILLIHSVANDFWQAVMENFERIVTDRLLRADETCSEIVRRTGILNGFAEEILPLRIAPYSLVIEPSMPILGLNGSYIIAAYANQNNSKGLVIFYNTFRNDYFAETRKDGVPGMIHDFDADTKEELEAKLKRSLASVLANLTAAD